jgi:hypothetical protein
MSAGRMLGGATAVGVLAAFVGTRLPIAEALLGLAVVPATVAWMVWRIPLGWLSPTAPPRRCEFRLHGERLQRADGCWDIDLRTADMAYRHARGLGYDIEFIDIRPASAPALTLLLAGEAHSGLLAELVRQRLMAPPRAACPPNDPHLGPLG